MTVFLCIWFVLVYALMAHWVWGDGLFDHYLTVVDFTGSTVVHICAGVTGLALVFLAAHSIPLAFLSAMMIWTDWWFNGGSGTLADSSSSICCSSPSFPRHAA